MNSTAKTLIPDKEWLVKDGAKKIGSISKIKGGYAFSHNGRSVPFKNLSDVKSTLGITVWEELSQKKKDDQKDAGYNIYGYACRNRPYYPVYNIKLRLPIYRKGENSKSHFCAGHYLIKFRKGWVKAFCPKLITLERYEYHGPFRDEAEVKAAITKLSENETIKHITD